MMWGKILKKCVALLCAAVLLFSCFAVPVRAEGMDNWDKIEWTQVPLTKIVDIILTQNGIVAKSEVIEAIWSSYKNSIVNAWNDVIDILTFEDTDACDRDTFIANCQSAGLSGYKLIALVNAYDTYCTDGTYSWLNKADEFGNYATAGMQKYLVSADGTEKGETITVDNEIVTDVVEEFNTYWEENKDYTLIHTMSFYDYAQASLIPNENDLTEYLEFIESADSEVVYFFCLNVYGTRFNIGYYPTNVLVNNASGYVNSVNADYSESQPFHSTSGLHFSSYSPEDDTLNRVVDYDLTLNALPAYCTLQSVYQFSNCAFKKYTTTCLVTKNGSNVKIWNDLDTLKMHVVGDDDIFYASNYDSSVVNGTSFTADYLYNYGDTYNYDIVKSEIDNSVDNSTEITESIVNSTVDNSVTNIVNNYYYYDTGDSSGDSSSDSSDDSESDNPFDVLLGKLGELAGNIIGALDDLVALLLGLLADGMSIIVNMFSKIIEMINSFREQTAGLGGALAAFFPYIPEEIWDIITGTIVIICGLAVIGYFKNK